MAQTSQLEPVAAPQPAVPEASRATGLVPLARAYFELTKPTIIVLLFITTVPAMVVAAQGWPGTGLVVATLIGGFLSAGSASALNQFADRDIDQVMRRTRKRPLPAGLVRPAHAVAFGVALGVASVAWLAWQVNALSALLSVLAIGVYVGVYTYGLKRRSVQNIVIGGAAGAAPPLIGWAAVTNSVEAPALLLFLVVFYWTPPHFWALSLRLQDDYRLAGVPMMPVVWGETETKRQIVLYTYLCVALTFIFGAVAHMGALYFLVAAGAGIGFIVLATQLRRSAGLERAIPVFLYANAYLAAVFGAMLVDQLLFG
ncbi:MAG: heme o synthase [Dehalococcoidia bacterium]